MDINNVFKELGLKEDHLKIYKASLEWGTTTISNISYKSKVARTSVYELIEDLINIGLIKVTLKEGSKLYTPSDPEILISLLEKKSSDLNNLKSVLKNNMKELKAIQNTKKNKPKVYLLEGAEGIKQVYNMTFDSKEVLVQCLTDDYGDVDETFFSEYFEKFFKQTDVKSKEILRENEDTEYLRYSSKKNLQLRVPVVGDIHTDLMVFEDKVVFVSFEKGASYSLVIEDQKIVDAMRTLYNLAWKQAGKEDMRVKKGEKIRTEYED